MEDDRVYYEHIFFEEVEEFLRICGEAVLQDFKCSFCNGYCHPPFRRSTDGDLVCELCQNNNINYEDKHQRRYLFLQKVHALLDFPCKYGCQFRARGVEIGFHEDECPNKECLKTDTKIPHVRSYNKIVYRCGFRGRRRRQALSRSRIPCYVQRKDANDSRVNSIL